MHTVMGSLFAKGGLVLHGEEEFEYPRPIVVGAGAPPELTRGDRR